MRTIISVLCLIQALNAIAAIPNYVYDQAHAWQNQDPPYPNIAITVWSGPDCNKTKAASRQSFNMDANGDNSVSGFLTGSYWLSRDLIDNERLDWSACDNPGSCLGTATIKGECMRFVQRTSPDSNSNALLKHTCYLLAPGATVSHHSRERWLTWCVPY